MDFSWFLTIPGMLITGGVLLLIIALVIFIATSSKKGQKKEKDASKNSVAGANEMLGGTTPPPVQPGLGDMNAVSPMSAPVPEMNSMAAQAGSLTDMPQPVEIPDNNSVIPNDMGAMGVTPEPMSQPSVFDNPMQTSPNSTSAFDVPLQTEQPVNESVSTINPDMGVSPMSNSFDSTVAPVTESPTMPISSENMTNIPNTPPVVENSVGGEAVSNPVPSVAPPTVEVPPIAQEPVQEVVPTVPDVAPVTESVTNTTNQNEPVSIYGGASPVVSKSDITQNETHEIYGGANPLDNTQTVNVSDVNQAVSTPVQSVTEAPQAVATPVQSVAEAPQTVATPVQPIAEAPQAVATPVQPVAEAPQAVATPVQPVAEAPQVVAAPVQPVSVGDSNNVQ